MTRSILILVLALISCNEGEKSKNILSKIEMAEVILDFYLAEAKIKNSNTSTDTASEMMRIFKKKTLKEKGISDSTLYKSYTYYISMPTELDEIMDIVIDTLSLQEQREKKNK